MDKFQNKYRIPSARLRNWDYASNGAYFITICTKNREHYFGEIPETEMLLNEMGKLAEQYWMEIPKHFPFVELGNFVIMPNHVHGILMIDKPDDHPILRTTPVETRLIASLPVEQPAIQTGGITGNKNPMFHDSISRIIRWYKGRCTFEIHQIHADFEWQARFHDHIIRNAESFERIHNYIASNPANWNTDKFNIKKMNIQGK